MANTHLHSGVGAALAVGAIAAISSSVLRSSTWLGANAASAKKPPEKDAAKKAEPGQKDAPAGPERVVILRKATARSKARMARMRKRTLTSA